jgi:hypothetical protein
MLLLFCRAARLRDGCGAKNLIFHVSEQYDCNRICSMEIALKKSRCAGSKTLAFREQLCRQSASIEQTQVAEEKRAFGI